MVGLGSGWARLLLVKVLLGESLLVVISSVSVHLRDSALRRVCGSGYRHYKGALNWFPES